MSGVTPGIPDGGGEGGFREVGKLDFWDSGISYFLRISGI